MRFGFAGVRHLGLIATIVCISLASSFAAVLPGSAGPGFTIGDGPAAMLAPAAGSSRVSTAPIGVDTTSRTTVVNAYFSQYIITEPPLGTTGAIDKLNTTNPCTPGSTSASFKAAVLQRINYFRAMSGVPAAGLMDPVTSAKAQQAAIMAVANGNISHNPPLEWICRTADAVTAAGKSNLALGANGWDAITMYMRDNGVSDVGHRKWLLYPQTVTFGTGDVNSTGATSIYGPTANTLWVQDANVFNERPVTRDAFVAWPPPGYVPYQVVYPFWSLSIVDASFTNATVSVVSNGSSLPVSVVTRGSGFGRIPENTIVFTVNNIVNPAAWPKPATDTTFQVTVSGITGTDSATVSYSVTVIDPGTAPSVPTATPTRTPTATAVPPTATAVPPTATATTVPPTATSLPPTATATTVPPTVTATRVPPTATATSVPPTATATRVPPTATATRVPPTATATSVSPTATNTAVPVTVQPTTVPPTATKSVAPTSTPTPLPTATATRVPPTATSVPPTATSTRVPPTATATRIPPSATGTRVPPTATATRVPPTATATRVPPTATPTKTATPRPTATNTPVPTKTATPRPSATATPRPSAACSSKSTGGVVNAQVTISCVRFKPGETVKIRWGASDAAPIASFVANGSGSGSVTFRIPEMAGGSYTVYARGDTSRSRASVSLKIRPSMNLSATTGAAGKTISFTLRGFKSGESVSVRWWVTDSTTRTLARVVVNSKGTFKGSFVVPRSTSAEHKIEAKGSAGSVTKRDFTVTGIASSAAAPDEPVVVSPVPVPAEPTPEITVEPIVTPEVEPSPVEEEPIPVTVTPAP